MVMKLAMIRSAQISWELAPEALTSAPLEIPFSYFVQDGLLVLLKLGLCFIIQDYEASEGQCPPGVVN